MATLYLCGREVWALSTQGILPEMLVKPLTRLMMLGVSFLGQAWESSVSPLRSKPALKNMFLAPPGSKGVINQDRLKKSHKPSILEGWDVVAVKEQARAAQSAGFCGLLSWRGSLWRSPEGTGNKLE